MSNSPSTSSVVIFISFLNLCSEGGVYCTRGHFEFKSGWLWSDIVFFPVICWHESSYVITCTCLPPAPLWCSPQLRGQPKVSFTFKHDPSSKGDFDADHVMCKHELNWVNDSLRADACTSAEQKVYTFIPLIPFVQRKYKRLHANEGLSVFITSIFVACVFVQY